MKRVKLLASLGLLVTSCAMISACGQPERPQTVSDFCLNDRRISFEPAPTAGADDPGNQYDTEQTGDEILAHNQVHDTLCASG